jgi:hypothetical protein
VISIGVVRAMYCTTPHRAMCCLPH